ncbi:MAG TPA: hypothetical protein VGK19_14780 [Capsulimonadaceae bacterium]|jgi:hypothetical protein
MDYLVNVLEFLVLIFIAMAWYIAKRDLTAAAALKHTSTANEIRELRETVEQIIVVLEERASAAEARLEAIIGRASTVEKQLSAVLQQPLRTWPTADEKPLEMEATQPVGEDAMDVPQIPRKRAGKSLSKQPADDRYQAVYDLADAGVSDVAEIARQTGLGQAEVSLVLNLRPR